MLLNKETTKIRRWLSLFGVTLWFKETDSPTPPAQLTGAAGYTKCIFTEG